MIYTLDMHIMGSEENALMGRLQTDAVKRFRGINDRIHRILLPACKTSHDREKAGNSLVRESFRHFNLSK